MQLEVSGVDAGYGRTPVLFDVSLTVREGRVTALMGRNGVGKTTLLNAIMGLLPLQAGRVTLDGRDLKGMPPYTRARLGVAYVPQGHQVFPHLTVRENLQVVAERSHGLRDQIRRRRNRGAAADGLEVLSLFPALTGLLDRPAGLLSGGQAQQLAISRALVTEPRLLLLDEPTEGIQPSIIEEIETAIVELHQSTGMTILVVEQYVEMALRLAQHYAVMDRGRIADRGETASADPSTFDALLAV